MFFILKGWTTPIVRYRNAYVSSPPPPLIGYLAFPVVYILIYSYILPWFAQPSHQRENSVSWKLGPQKMKNRLLALIGVLTERGEGGMICAVTEAFSGYTIRLAYCFSSCITHYCMGRWIMRLNPWLLRCKWWPDLLTSDYTSRPYYRLHLIHSKLHLIQFNLHLIHFKIHLIHSKLHVIRSKLLLIHPKLYRSSIVEA